MYIVLSQSVVKLTEIMPYILWHFMLLLATFKEKIKIVYHTLSGMSWNGIMK